MGLTVSVLIEYKLDWPEELLLNISRSDENNSCLNRSWIDENNNAAVNELSSFTRDLSSSFYSLLKTFRFAWAWAGSASE